MLAYIPAADRHHAAPAPWLSSYFLFSFADYYDKGNVHFGPLRVFNDDSIAPQNGFPQHPHSEMEIITLVLEGEVTHEDTLGNRTTTQAGEVQRLTAGTGVAHSEMNRQDKALQLYQLWFMPSQSGLAPSYEQKDPGFLKGPSNELIPLATGQRVLEDVVYLNSNSTVYWANLDCGKSILFKTFPLRFSFLYVRQGCVRVLGQELGPGDQARISNEDVLEITATKDAQFMLLDLPSDEANY
ncbi:pirin family protein [Hymenobacter sp. RP-2-7]|uniref:Pirin family protein n=1 Tax=Hymenobacter polaris TaxID=2682546 RepID=A0A7Y0FLL7_9BACT|nr:pirin family protein [Hymenobacter polaris]NML64529.1 pirin family protein [Hymenobacter polaris]